MAESVHPAVRVAAVLVVLLSAAPGTAGPEPLGDLFARPVDPPRPAIWASDARGVLWRIRGINFTRELWWTDASGTRRVGTRSSFGSGGVALGGLFFYLRDGRLYRTDRTALGTHPARPRIDAVGLARLGGELYVLTTDDRWQIWTVIDGALQRAATVSADHGEVVGYRVDADDRLWFTDRTTSSMRLWMIEGGRPPRIMGEVAGAEHIFLDSVLPLGPGRWFVVVDRARESDEPHVLDGDGIRLVADLGRSHRAGVSWRGGFAGLDGRVFFMGTEHAGLGLWASDGTIEGTARVPNGENADEPRTALWRAGSSLMLVDRQDRPWALRSLQEGLQQVHEGPVEVLGTTADAFWLLDEEETLIRVSATSFERSSIEGLGGVARKVAARPGGEVWAVVGVEPGASEVLVLDGRGRRVGALGRIWTARNGDSAKQGPFGAGAVGFMVASVGDDPNTRAWIRVAGDGRLTIVDHADLGSSEPIVSIGERVLFRQIDPLYGVHLRALGGDGGGARVLRAWSGGGTFPVAVGVTGLVAAARFRGPAQGETWTLYETDGTPAGTVPVQGWDFSPTLDAWAAGPDAAYLVMTSTGGRTVVRRYAPATGELAERALPPALAFRYYQRVTAVRGGLFGVVETGSGFNAWRLWPEPVEVASFERGARFATAALPDRWVILRDGEVSAVGARGSPQTVTFDGGGPFGLAAVDDTLYFSATDDAHGRELWAFEGARAWRVRDIAAGPASSAPEGGLAVDGRLVFSADDGVFGRETWVSDGTEAGTRLLFDLAPGLAPGAMIYRGFGGGYVLLGDHVYFVGVTRATGGEPWRFERALVTDDQAPPPPPPPPVAPPPVAPAPDLASDSGCGCAATPGRESVVAPWLLLGLVGLLGLRGRRASVDPR